jgi:hypothetical protein
MQMSERPGLVAEIHCLNCSRVLAQAVRRDPNGTVEIRPADHRKEVQVTIVEQRRLRCRHCGGRAFFDVFRETVERRGALRTLMA